MSQWRVGASCAGAATAQFLEDRSEGSAKDVAFVVTSKNNRILRLKGKRESADREVERVDGARVLRAGRCRRSVYIVFSRAGRYNRARTIRKLRSFSFRNDRV